jgi:hypothetical protein
LLAWRRNRIECLRIGGVLFLFPLMFYFTHPEPYHLRPLDPLLVVLGCQAILTLRDRIRERAGVASNSGVLQEA